MKLYKRRRPGAVILCLLMIIMLFPVTAFAADNIDLNRDVSLTIICQNDGTLLSGAEFDIYQVATVNEHVELTPIESFIRFNADIQSKNGQTWRTLSSTLESYVLNNNITPASSGKTDAGGIVSFPADEKKLTPGLYLVLGHLHRQNGYIYDALPFMVMLPSQDRETGEWLYDVTVSAKYDFEPDSNDTITRKVLKVWKDKGYEKQRPKEITVQLLRDGKIFDTVILNAENNWRYAWTDLDSKYKWTVAEKEPENYTVKVVREGVTFIITNTYNGETSETPTTPDEPVLPRTGQLWWPVPVLLSAGLLFIVIGLIRKRGGMDEE
ncbi:MAG: Cna B-type domain-containing protein [Lachnospiraceae bacterium]|jgi:hypothetical protein